MKRRKETNPTLMFKTGMEMEVVTPVSSLKLTCLINQMALLTMPKVQMLKRLIRALR